MGVSSATAGCTLSDCMASKDKLLTLWPCHTYFACAKLLTAVVAASA